MMETYEMTCSCGHVMKVDASSQKEAVSKMKSTMDEGAIRAHWQEMHQGEKAPTVAEVHKMIERNLMPASVAA